MACWELRNDDSPFAPQRTYLGANWQIESVLTPMSIFFQKSEPFGVPVCHVM